MTGQTDTPGMGDAAQADPAVIAAEEDAKAGAAFNAFSENQADRNYEDTPEWKAAQDRIGETGTRFADTVPTTAAGALAKMKFLAEGDGPDDDTYDARHVRTVMEYLERGSFAATNPGKASDALDDLGLEISKVKSATRLLVDVTSLPGDAIDPHKLGYLVSALEEHGEVLGEAFEKAYHAEMAGRRAGAAA